MLYLWCELGSGRARLAFSTRRGGVSRGPFAGLNLGYHTGDDPVRVATNRRIFWNALGIREDRVSQAHQVHGERVLVVRHWPRAPEEGDAQVTALPGVVLAGLFADCLAVYLYDARRGVVALAHAGWRGTARGVARRCLEEMERSFGTDPGDCVAVLSPAIGPCCYEVGPEVAAFFRSCPGLQRLPGGSWRLDLWEANAHILAEAGVPPRQIFAHRLCTSCHRDLFFSHRAQGGVAGRMVALIYLTPPGPGTPPGAGPWSLGGERA